MSRTKKIKATLDEEGTIKDIKALVDDSLEKTLDPASASWIEKATIEKAELDERIKSLTHALSTEGLRYTHPTRDLLVCQLDHMTSYSYFLGLRLDEGYKE